MKRPPHTAHRPDDPPRNLQEHLGDLRRCLIRCLLA